MGGGLGWNGVLRDYVCVHVLLCGMGWGLFGQLAGGREQACRGGLHAAAQPDPLPQCLPSTNSNSCKASLWEPRHGAPPVHLHRPRLPQAVHPIHGLVLCKQRHTHSCKDARMLARRMVSGREAPQQYLQSPSLQ